MKGALEEAASRNVQTHEGYEFSMAAVRVSAQLACFSAYFKKMCPGVNSKLLIFC